MAWTRALNWLWDGGSSFDTWLNICSTKIAEIALTIPHSWAQAGLPSAVVAQLLHFLMGWWTGCITNLLYLKHRKQLMEERENQTIQLHEVLGVLGKPWKVAALVLNIGILFTISTVEILACRSFQCTPPTVGLLTSIVFYIDDRLDKRTWTLIFGGVFALSVFIPSAQNYRAWSFIGVIATVYNAFYLLIAGAVHQKVPNVRRPLEPREFSEYFIPLTNFIAVGTEAIPVELMDAMWRPQDYKTPWTYGILYTAVISIIPTMSLFWRFGDKFLAQPNALGLLPRTVFRDAAVVLLLLHQFIVFGIFTLPVYLLFEKLFKVNKDTSFIRRVLVRIPVFFTIWLAALAFPFFGLSGPISVSIFSTWGLYILPCSAYIFVFWATSAQARKSVERPVRAFNLETVFSINVGIILWMIAMSALGLWANMKAIVTQTHEVTKCYKCIRT